MPSIEIICLAQKHPIDCSKFSFRIETGSELVSHRLHSSHFQRDFDSMEGCIYHLLGSKGPTAFELLKKDWYDDNGDSNEQDDNIEFIATHNSCFINLVKTLIDKSPVKKIVFTSDYQFGPEIFKRFDEMSMDDFIEEYKNKRLRMNSLYVVKKLN